MTTRYRQRCVRKGEALKIHLGRPWHIGRSTLSFLAALRHTFGSLTFATGEDEDLKMLPSGPTQEHLALASLSASDRSCSGSDPCVGSYIHTAKIVRGIPLVTSIFRPLTGASSSSSSASTPDPDSSDDYPEIGVSVCGKLTEGGRLICIMAPNGDLSHNSYNRYPTIERSEAPTLEHRATAWFITWIRTSMLSRSRRLWRPSSAWWLKVA
jgi:hypothetical protein